MNLLVSRDPSENSLESEGRRELSTGKNTEVLAYLGKVLDKLVERSQLHI